MSEAHPSRRLYVVVFACLMLLTFATWAVAGLDLGPLNSPIALLIASAKAALVGLFFMHVRFASRLTRLFAVTGIAWLVILMALTLGDYLTRGWIPVIP